MGWVGMPWLCSGMPPLTVMIAFSTGAPSARHPTPSDAGPARLTSPVETRLRRLLGERILILGGAMGTMIQQYKLTDAQYRGERFAGHDQNWKGNN